MPSRILPILTNKKPLDLITPSIYVVLFMVYGGTY